MLGSEMNYSYLLCDLDSIFVYGVPIWWYVCVLLTLDDPVIEELGLDQVQSSYFQVLLRWIRKSKTKKVNLES